MTDTPAHTPLPYLRDGTLIYALDESQTCNRIALRVDGGFVMNWKRDAERTTSEEVEATAEFIHRACNSHYQLVSALREWGAIMSAGLFNVDPDRIDRAREMQRAAIIQATGEA